MVPCQGIWSLPLMISTIGVTYQQRYINSLDYKVALKVCKGKVDMALCGLVTGSWWLFRTVTRTVDSFERSQGFMPWSQGYKQSWVDSVHRQIEAITNCDTSHGHWYCTNGRSHSLFVWWCIWLVHCNCLPQLPHLASVVDTLLGTIPMV